MRSEWVTLGAVMLMGCMPTGGGPGKYNATNGYGRPTDSKYVSYFDQLTEGTTRSFVGLLPASLSGFDPYGEQFEIAAIAGPNTLEVIMHFERVEGDKICFSRSTSDAPLNDSADMILRDLTRSEFVVHTIANRAAIENAQIWPVEGEKLTEFAVTEDEVEQKAGYSKRRFEVSLCGPKPANVESAEFLAVVVGGETSGQTPNALLLWRLVK